MAKRKRIIWTPQAKFDRYDILNYYACTGISNKILQKIDSQLRNSVRHLSVFPNFGKLYGTQNERIIYSGYYCIIYKIVDDSVQILQIWDTRRNPEDLKL